MNKELYTVTYREYPNAEIKTQSVYALSEEQAKLTIKFENEITHNQIEFYQVNKI